MQATNHSVSAADLETPPPVIGVADFAERRLYPRWFPKDRAERNCYQYLLGVMRASPDYQQWTKEQLEQWTKAELEKYCRGEFGVTVDSFEYCWGEAIEMSEANWDQPGRRPDPPR